MHRIIILCALIGSLLCGRELLLLPNGNVHLHMFDVGQGDAFLVVTPRGSHIVVDGGRDLSLLTHLGTIMPFFKRTIDLVVLTHPDADHIAALPALLKRYNVDTILLTGVAHSSGRYAELLDAIDASNTRVLLADTTNDIVIDGVAFALLWPQRSLLGAELSSQNNHSIVMRMHYGNDSFLFTGDIEHETEHSILAMGSDVRSDIMTAPHHGSRTSSSTGLLLSVQPHTALFSAGRNNRYGHPHPDVLERYHALGISTKTTAVDGVVSMEFDGL